MKVTEEGLLHYTLCGLNYVYLTNGFRRQETEYGMVTAVDDIEGLRRAIAHDIVHNRAHLSGREVRFLRKELDLSQNGLALCQGVDGQTVARWEKGRTRIPGPADRLLRVLYKLHVGGDDDVAGLVATLAQLDDIDCERRSFEESGGTWRLSAA
jgi:DNA-binding transcriptional regulator YiaG